MGSACFEECFSHLPRLPVFGLVARSIQAAKLLRSLGIVSQQLGCNSVCVGHPLFLEDLISTTCGILLGCQTQVIELLFFTSRPVESSTSITCAR